jgi:hypothetical protein
MKVKIGDVTIPEATVRRFIDMQSSLPLSMVHVSYTDQAVDDSELTEAFKKNLLLPFECEILKTDVLVHGFGHEAGKDYYILQEPAGDVSCGYKSVDWTQPTGNTKMVFIIPEDVEDLKDPYELSLLPYKRLILRKDIPKEWFKKSNAT